MGDIYNFAPSRITRKTSYTLETRGTYYYAGLEKYPVIFPDRVDGASYIYLRILELKFIVEIYSDNAMDFRVSISNTRIYSILTATAQGFDDLF